MKPYIQLIVSEDNGPEPGCYGHHFVKTLHLDRLASEGLRFEKAVWLKLASCSDTDCRSGHYHELHGRRSAGHVRDGNRSRSALDKEQGRC